MKRSPLKRKSRLKPRRSAPRKSVRVRDKEYMARVRELPCVCTMLDLEWGTGVRQRQIVICGGEMHAHHMGKRGMGQKCSDLETIPFCAMHHSAWHDCRGPFTGWTKEARQAFAISAISWTKSRLGHPKEET